MAMRIVFMGSPDFAVPCLRALATGHDVALVVSQPDKPAGRGGELRPPAVKVAAGELGLPVFQPISARTGELEQALIRTRAELAVVVAYGKILPRSVLDALPRGCINVHASLLPKYRGAAPVQWAVIAGEPETGVSIMQLDEGMDTGPVLFEQAVAISPSETAGELLVRLAPLGADAAIAAVAQLAAGTAHATPQDEAKATHAPMLRKVDGVIDFAQPAHVVAARIRGVDPWPGAQASLITTSHANGQPVKLFRAVPADTTAAQAAGTVLGITDDGAEIACAIGTIYVREIQIAGRKRMTAKQLAAGRGIAVGDSFVALPRDGTAL